MVDKIGFFSEYCNGYFVKYGYGCVNVGCVVVEVLCCKEIKVFFKEVENIVFNG